MVIRNYANKVMDNEYNLFMTLMHVSVSKHLMDEHFTVIWANSYFYDLIQYPKDEYEALFHNHVDEYYKDDPDAVAAMEKVIVSAYKDGRSGYEFECPMPTKSGKTVWIRVTGRFTDETYEGIPVIYTVYTDITSLKELQLELEDRTRKLDEALKMAEEANRAKSEFLSRMSHDIRTPMNAIIGMTDIAAAHINEPDRVRDCLSKISFSNEHLLGLINDVLDVSKIESGNMVLNNSPLSLSELLEQIETIIRPVAEAKKQEFEIRLHGIRHGQLCADELHLKQIFINILSNASKFTPEGGTISLDVKESETEEPGYGSFCFIFRDTGMGMQPEFVEHIFDAFTRERDSRVDKTEGSGLGMAIVRRLTDMMNGTICIDTEPGKGSTFTICLPLQIENSAQSAGEYGEDVREVTLAEGEERTAPGDFSGKRILLVEDNELNREVALELLSVTGAAMEYGCNGEEGVRKFSESPEGYYDLILMDVQMPVMNGYDAARAIRGMKRADALTVPILAMTADAFAEDIKEAKEDGMNDHLAKPMDVSVMTRIIAEYI